MEMYEVNVMRKDIKNNIHVSIITVKERLTKPHHWLQPTICGDLGPTRFCFEIHIESIKTTAKFLCLNSLKIPNYVKKAT